MPEPKKLYKPAEVKPAVMAALTAEFPHEDAGMLEQITNPRISELVNYANTHSIEDVPQDKVDSIVYLSGQKVYFPMKDALVDKLGVETKHNPQCISRVEANDLIVRSYIFVEKNDPSELKPGASPKDKVRRGQVCIAQPRVAEAFKAGIENGDFAGMSGNVDSVGLLRYFNRLPGYVNAGIHDSEVAFRVITDPNHYGRKVYEKDIERMRGIFDLCNFDEVQAIDVVSLMETMDEILDGEQHPIVRVRAMGTKVQTPVPSKSEQRIKTSAELADRLAKKARDDADVDAVAKQLKDEFAEAETDII